MPVNLKHQCYLNDYHIPFDEKDISKMLEEIECKDMIEMKRKAIEYSLRSKST